MFQFVKRILLFFLTAHNHSIMIEHGYVLEKIGTKYAYSNGQCTWYYDTIHITSIWKLKEMLKDEAKMFANEPIKYKLISQDRAWGYRDTELFETADINLVASEYERLFIHHMEWVDSANPCIHIFKGKARIGVFKSILSNKENVIRELLAILQR